MGRRKLEMKRIDDKSSRQVTFFKRRSGLIKKARHLSVLCDVDIAVVVSSARGELYEFCSGRSNSVGHILSRYQKSFLQAGERTRKPANDDFEVSSHYRRFRTCKELLRTLDGLVEENNTEELSVTDMMQLEQELGDALVQTRVRKTQLMMDYISTLKEKERKLGEEKEEMQKKVAAARQNSGTGARGDYIDGSGGLNDLATNQLNSPQRVTLPLFNG